MNIKTLTIKTDFLPGCEHGWGNGYIGVPPEHPWFNEHYDNISVNIHGGLTYSEDHPPLYKLDGYWWLGFDCNHSGDNQINCNEEFVNAETEYLKIQALAAVNQ